MLTPEQVGTHPDALAARAILKSLVPDMVTGTRTANAAVNP
jgi:hypothetical protein